MWPMYMSKVIYVGYSVYLNHWSAILWAYMDDRVNMYIVIIQIIQIMQVNIIIIIDMGVLFGYMDVFGLFVKLALLVSYYVRSCGPCSYFVYIVCILIYHAILSIGIITHDRYCLHLLPLRIQDDIIVHVVW